MIVVADTSVLLNLSRVGQIDLLIRIFAEVLVPLEVASEFHEAAARLPRFAGLTLPAWIGQRAARTIPQIIRSAQGLDPGETAALALALEISADAVLVDERRGHEVAVQLGLRTIGVLGIILQGKRSGFLPAIRPVLERLETEANFWISQEIKLRILEMAQE